MNKWIKWSLATAGAAIVLLMLLAALRPTPLTVDAALVEARTLTVSIDAQGRTRAHQPYVVNAPLAGQLQRISLVEGQRVSAGETLAMIALAPENPRNEAAIRANLSAARAREESARAAIRDAESAAERSTNEAQRREQLYSRGLIGEEERDTFRQAAEAAQARLLNMRASLNAARADIDIAQALLLGIGADASADSRAAVLSPTAGTIHRVHERSERVLQAGQPLFTISNDDALELVIDLLTRDAVRVSPGDRILINDWGGDEALEGRVIYIEPEAFTKVSALGVEEQRVNVLGELLSVPAALGAEYRVETSIITWQADDVLSVPVHALFRREDRWQAFVIDNGRARLREVSVGHRGGELFEVSSGLQPGDRVILFPSDQIADGVSVQAR